MTREPLPGRSWEQPSGVGTRRVGAVAWVLVLATLGCGSTSKKGADAEQGVSGASSDGSGGGSTDAGAENTVSSTGRGATSGSTASGGPSAGGVGGVGASSVGAGGSSAGSSSAVGGSAGAGTAGAGATAGCVDVSQVDELQREDLEVIGTGFDADEGHTVRIIATLGEPAYGVGEAPIQAGAFDIFMPGALSDYTGLAVHIDRVRNDACDPEEEFIWQRTSGTLSAPGPGFSMSGGHYVWEVTPETLWIFDLLGPCDLNGIFDLTVPLPCGG